MYAISSIASSIKPTIKIYQIHFPLNDTINKSMAPTVAKISSKIDEHTIWCVHVGFPFRKFLFLFKYIYICSVYIYIYAVYINIFIYSICISIYIYICGSTQWLAGCLGWWSGAVPSHKNSWIGMHILSGSNEAYNYNGVCCQMYNIYTMYRL